MVQHWFVGLPISGAIQLAFLLITESFFPNRHRKGLTSSSSAVSEESLSSSCKTSPDSWLGGNMRMKASPVTAPKWLRQSLPLRSQNLRSLLVARSAPATTPSVGPPILHGPFGRGPMPAPPCWVEHKRP